MLARQLLRLQLRARDRGTARSNPAAVVWLEATYQGAAWLRVFGKTRDRPRHVSAYLGGKMAAWVHYPVLQYYQIPMVSVSDVMFPLAMKQFTCPADEHGSRQRHEYRAKRHAAFPCAVNNTFWSESQYAFFEHHTDACCHPTAEMHHVIARVLAHNIDLDVVGPGARAPLPPDERDFTLDPSRYKPVRTVITTLPPPKTTTGGGTHGEAKVDAAEAEFLKFGLDPKWVLARPPWRLTTEELKLFVLARKHVVDFTRSTASTTGDGARAAERSIIGDVGPDGWRVYADSKQKFGLIATRAGAHVAVPVDLYSENDWLAVGPLQFRGTPDCNESAASHSYGLDSHCR